MRETTTTKTAPANEPAPKPEAKPQQTLEQEVAALVRRGYGRKNAQRLLGLYKG